ncbi:RNA polymerase sigma-54 factor [Poriferisphaera corsica]|uniref:RNA polymerase sigma-54 factor n=2 Tax=Poriferisphaera corsica TaxID=2528020 RepID=A0A517YUM3_9BACT|nr:RNA polymerase sigma-54 factor [Poriferisphaera corsica]
MRLSQQMKLAPRMIQSMEILQMTQQALEERIEQELANNPTLELQEPGSDEKQIASELKQEERDSREGERELYVSDDAEAKNTGDDFERLNNISEEYGDSWAANTTGTGEKIDFQQRAAKGTGERDAKIDAMANTAARGASLYEQLIDQWRMVELPEEEILMGVYLIGFVDGDGYLRTEDSVLLDQAPGDLKDEKLLEGTIYALQRTLEPTGLCARDIRECFLLQIDAKMRNEGVDLAVERLLVNEYLKEIEGNKLPMIAKKTGLEMEDITAAIAKLRQFTPHPGRLLADESPQRITPDAIVDFIEDEDCYVARLASERLPQLQISESYAEMAKDKGVEKKTRDFINNNIRSASWIIDAVHQRSSTLLRVVNVVLNAQREFFDVGEQALKPLPMTVVADQLGIHVATVSRAVNEKYIQTPRGIYPLRMFFSGGTETGDGESVSWSAVQAKLKEIIDGENKMKPLSDDSLVEALKNAGIDIARRTVAKYRKQMNIGTARQRKQFG